MTILVVLSLVWTAVVVLALVAALGTTAWNLRRARTNLAGIADDLERISTQAEPLESALNGIGDKVEVIVAALARVDTALADVGSVLDRLKIPQRG